MYLGVGVEMTDTCLGVLANGGLPDHWAEEGHGGSVSGWGRAGTEMSRNIAKLMYLGVGVEVTDTCLGVSANGGWADHWADPAVDGGGGWRGRAEVRVGGGVLGPKCLETSRN